MSHYGSYGPRRRTEIRKKKKVNIFVNSAIAVVLIAIVFVGGILIFGGNGSERASGNDDVNEENEQNEQNEQNVQNDTSEETEEINENNEDAIDSGENAEVEQGTNSDNSSDSNSTNEEATNDPTSDETEEENPEPETGNVTEPVAEGEWEPIGTVQEEPFTAVYEEDHVNWVEMEAALKYATGIEDITIWWLGNGGDHQSAEGYVSDYETRNTPYKVRLEWVTNEGWMPVSVEQLDENPYNE